ncbi:MAG: TIGR02996 domain-containing protein [Gemmataceae bacterium]|nr:TIGR02996 domain-containing protein [Gemmataceae bacterium]
MTEEDALTAAILASPRDDAPRLVFADWLEEGGDPRGEFLRIAVRLEDLEERGAPPEMRGKLQWVREIARLRQRLRALREVIPLGWALRMTRGWIKECNLVGSGANCPRRWELLQETDDPTVRRCGHCLRNVWYCWSASDVGQAIGSGHPVVLALAMDRG